MNLSLSACLDKESAQEFQILFYNGWSTSDRPVGYYPDLNQPGILDKHILIH
jgi:hypothetical protein